uniref:3-hydroxyacyl-CoA dehydrogenase NAD binding domain-containing protein n=1 Tax=Coccolithus braarudii TaxID=221442 RepID=A0A7S0L0B3_9EUKA|mmetsp:Transcript_10242/g.22234  ORF Transcript_10242/g.22234 Transcript_10242/m.22234 type:complete len:452 (+) Transcript_10242:29-1384(+)
MDTIVAFVMLVAFVVPLLVFLWSRSEPAPEKSETSLQMAAREKSEPTLQTVTDETMGDTKVEPMEPRVSTDGECTQAEKAPTSAEAGAPTSEEQSTSGEPIPSGSSYAPTLVDFASVRKIAIIGTGTIGSGWAAYFVAQGYTVCAYVRSEASEEKFYDFLRVAWRKMVARGLASDPDGWRAVTCERDLGACVRAADYVQESVVEELALKQSIIEQIDAHTRPHVFIASSSSFIPLSLIRARATRHPQRIATAHPTLPQWDDFVEVLGASAEATRWLATFLGREHVGMDAITMKHEMHGHVHNFCLQVVVSGGVGLIKAGITTAEELDVALVHMAKLIIASGGASNAFVGAVGNGSEDATAALAADVMLGLPAAIPACFISRVLPPPLAKLAVASISRVSSLYTGSPLVKRLAKRVAYFSNKEFFAVWRAGPGNEAYEERTLQRLNALARLG